MYWGEEPGSRFYMCRAERRGNYRNCPPHTLDHQSYISFEVLLPLQALRLNILLTEDFLVDTIIPLLFKQLSIVFEGATLFSTPRSSLRGAGEIATLRSQ